MPVPVTAIFDIGKTNKKFLLFDSDYKVVWEKKEKLEEIADDDGDPCENINRLTEWALQTMDEALAKEEFDIQLLNFSTYGASFVHLDENGEVVTPLYNYLKPYPDDVLEEFHSTYGSREEIAVETASPPMGMLNSGLQIYWLKKKKPEMFKKIAHSLHLPQYIGYLFSKSYNTELTSIGCHTTLWDFREKEYHQWVKKEGISSFFPIIKDVSQTKSTSLNGKDVQVGIGIHDSSAALAPFLLAFEEPFLLLSTGTWSIAFNPFNQEPLTYEELEKDCLCYMNIEGNPVKAARFFLGGEYAHQKSKLDQHFNRLEEKDDVKADAQILQKIIKEHSEERQLVQEKSNTSGPLPHPSKGEWDISQFDTYKEGYHQLVYDLMDIQYKSIKLATGKTDINKIIVTGGFTKNNLFLKLLATRFPDKEVYTTSLSNSTALGAAMVLGKNDRTASDQKSLIKQLLDLEQHERLPSISAHMSVDK